MKLLIQLPPQLELGVGISFAAREAVQQRDSPRELQVLAHVPPCTDLVSARTLALPQKSSLPTSETPQLFQIPSPLLSYPATTFLVLYL